MTGNCVVSPRQYLSQYSLAAQCLVSQTSSQLASSSAPFAKQYGTMLLKPPLAPMETRSVDEIPTGDGWRYEPKWDGFRCIAFRDVAQIYLQSKNGQPLARYFPDVASALAALPAKQFVVDGELVVPVDGALSFDELQLRLHPAASRVQKLSQSACGDIHRIRSSRGE